MRYHIGDKILYPMHGAGEIVDIEEKELLGEVKSYYVLKLPAGDMKIMLMADKLEEIGVRDVISKDTAYKVIDKFAEKEAEDDEANWNKRYRDNMARIKTGDIFEVLSVTKSLVIRDIKKGLSTGERKMLNNVKQILFSELMLATKKSCEELEEKLDLALR